jgi:hypothetical protein
VRCGSCLHIFIARDHLVTRAVKKPEPTQLIESIYKEALEANPPTFDTSSFDPSQSSDFEETRSHIPEWSSIDPYQETETDDTQSPTEDTNTEVFPELEEQESDDWAPTWDSSANLDDFNTDETDDPDPTNELAQVFGQDDEQESSDESDDSWAINLLEELGDDGEALAAQGTEIPEAQDIPEEVASDEIDLDSQEAHWIDNIDEPTLDIEASDGKPKHSQSKLYSSLSLLAALALFAQFAQMNFDHYSRIEPWRGAYATACNMGLCTLPSTRDTRKIKAYNLVVRTHPEQTKALIVDAIILNTAPFSQPFPKLELRFNDVANKIIAARQFQPSEYLAGELLGQTEMPKQQPVHLSLEIVDPGPEAMGYSIHIPE